MTDNFWTGSHTRGISRRQLLRTSAVTGTGVLAAALVGCGTKPQGGSSAPASPGTGGAGAPAASNVKTGGRLTSVMEGGPATFDNHTETTFFTLRPTAPAYNQLVQFDPKDAFEKPTSIIGDLAEKWEIAPDGQTYTFHLVKNAKFHDGTPFTSADVKASLERNQNPPQGLVAPRSGQLSAVKSYEAPDANTLVIKLSRPASPLSLLPILAQGWMSIYSKKDLDGKFDFKKQINGTGPYRLKAYELGNRVSLDKNKDYHIPGRPYMDGIDYFIVPEASTRLANTQSGSILVNPGVSPTDAETLKKAMGDKADFPVVPSLGFNNINVASMKKPWNDIRVRQAISMTISREDAIKIIAKGDAQVGGYTLPGGGWALTQKEIEALPGYAPYSDATLAEAKKLLSAAGVADGLAINVTCRNLQSHQDLATFVAAQLSTKLGLKAKPDPIESAAAYAKADKGDFDLFVIGHAFAIDDPDALFSEFFLPKAVRNYSKVGSQALEDLYLKQSTELDPQKRVELVKQLQKVAIPEFGKIVTHWGNSRGVINKNVRDYTFHTSLYNNVRFENVWLNS